MHMYKYNNSLTFGIDMHAKMRTIILGPACTEMLNSLAVRAFKAPCMDNFG